GACRTSVGAEQQVLLHSQLRKQPPALWYQCDAKIDDLLSAEPREVMRPAIDLGENASRCRPHQPHDALHERALAVAVGAEQDNGLSGADRDRDVLDHTHSAIAGMDALKQEATGQGRPSLRLGC